MRTTIVFEDDVAAAVERVRREQHLGLSEAVNTLVRAGLTAARQRRPFEQETARMGMRVDVSNVADVLELLEGPAAR